MSVSAEIKGGNLVITIPVMENRPTSKSGKSKVVASTFGNVQLPIEIDGKPITLGLNAYIKA